MSRLWRDGNVRVAAGLLERVDVRLGGGGVAAAAPARSASARHGRSVYFTAAVAHENELHLLLEIRDGRCFLRRDRTAAEHADVRELVEMREADASSLHAAQGKAGHAAIGLI